MSYDERLVAPMRAELVKNGFKELRSATDVEAALTPTSGTALVAVNSVCGCAAGAFRPAIVRSASHAKKPTHLLTVFAGQDKEATAKARELFLGYPPSSPSAALLKDGKVVFMLSRSDIEGYSVEEISDKLTAAFEKHC